MSHPPAKCSRKPRLVSDNPTGYRPRRPAETVIWQTVRDHWLAFVADADAHDRNIPWFIQAAFEKFLTCGHLAGGFARLRRR